MQANLGYSPNEEILHSLTALIGVVAIGIGTPWLVLIALGHGNNWLALGAAAFGLGAFLMFATSTLYHFVRRPQLKAVFRRLDHSAIYLLIAGTYTPFTLGVIGGALGWSLFAIVWSLALAGVAIKLGGLLLNVPMLSTALYLLMGWIGVVAFRQLWTSMSAAQFGWLAAGGLCYTAGVPFYLWKRRSFAHVAWHVFILAGVACHFMAVKLLVDART
jgi:hemolysin III